MALTNSSYDVRQNINAKVIGVLQYNNKIREKLLQRNIGVYVLHKAEERIGYISNLYSIESNNPLSLGEEGLFGYTHTVDSDYQQKIKNTYNIRDDFQYYQNSDNIQPSPSMWNRLYDNYVDYVQATIGVNPQLKNDDFLNSSDIHQVIKNSQIGITYPDPINAKNGQITTNINKVGNKDTKLGVIANNFYSQALINAAHIHEQHKANYITPELYEIFGNKVHNLPILGLNLAYDPATGRVVLEKNTNAVIERLDNIDFKSYQYADLLDANCDIADNRNARYRNIVRNAERYLPFLDNKYTVNLITRTVSGNSVTGSKNYGIWSENGNDITYHSSSNTYNSIRTKENEGLLSVTDDLYHNKQIGTIVSRFHTTDATDITHTEVSLFQTAVSPFGLSHGRNLLTKDGEKGSTTNVNGYDNPYCRVWTHHHQYDNIDKMLRPFNLTKEGLSLKSMGLLQRNWWQYGRRKGSAQRLSDNSTLNRNGFVNISPSTDSKIDVTRCMFSIENLAWKDVSKELDKNNNIKPLSKEQIGPNGGRIMWFPPYGLDFNETVGVNWQPNDFIGRGEKIYTYTNTERSGTLSFIMLVDHPSILDMWKKNSASKHDTEDEKTLLRFFAGCETLELDNVVAKSNPELEEETPPVAPPDEEPIVEETTPDVVFYIFFPNNFSGKFESGSNFDYDLDYLTTNYETSGQGDIGYSDTDWKYMVDEAYKDEKLQYEANYKNSSNFLLNEDLAAVNQHIGETNVKATTTFKTFFTNPEGILNGTVIHKAYVQGYATNQGLDATKNALLAIDRGIFAENYLKTKLNVDQDNITLETGKISNVDDVDKNNVSGISAKIGRCARVILKTKNPDPVESVETLTQDTPQTNEEVISESTLLSNSSDKKSKRNKRKNKKKDKKKKDSETIPMAIPEVIDVSDNMQQLINEYNDTIAEELKRNKVINGVQKEPEEIEHDSKHRWDEEAQYFSMLKDNDNFLYNKIIDKVKYFSPAFHSMTPEGFNARLGFLHQCTRQGMTMGVSDKNTTMSAGNLAFGRPPICVLRIGDFYHTKIIIDSVTITYENNQWDMNPEGIGMQPTFAKISMNFKFLGGSDIDAPISRLQNALSFNFYANQSIYDDRADIGVYDRATKKPTILGKPWKPNFEE